MKVFGKQATTMSATKTIIISTPRFITAEPTFELALSPASPLLSTKISKSSATKKASLQCVSTMEKIVCPPLPVPVLGIKGATPSASRKRRLDHLSFDEKMQRKKLKNRIAAQSSRDRKKAKLDELEVEVTQLREKNKLLSDRCQTLETESQRLVEENRQLREQLSQAPSVGCGPVENPAGPAVSSASDPLQQGQGPQPALGLTLLTFLLTLACQRSQTSSETLMAMSSSLHSKTWQTACLKKLQQTLTERKINQRYLPKEGTNASIPKWWGRHQKMWNPVGVPT